MIDIFWYDTDQKAYSTHVEAMRSGKKCYLHYNDTTYNKTNWLIEPEISIDTLYKMRAQEIRDTYERVIICLSGGIDSRNMMEVFYKNKIHIDEILSIGSFSQDSHFGSDENNNREVYINVKEYLKEINLPNTKKTFLDYTETFKNPKSLSAIKEKGEYWYCDIGIFTKSPHSLFWRDLKKYLIKDNKKTCYLMGAGKTYVNFDDAGPYVIFSEPEVTDYGANFKDDNLFREHFYWGNTLTSAELIKKQAYIMLNALKILKDKNVFMNNYIKLYDKIMYKSCTPLFIPTRKTRGHLLSINDQFMKKKLDSDMYKYYIQGLKKMASDIGMEYKIHTTKKYYLSCY